MERGSLLHGYGPIFVARLMKWLGRFGRYVITSRTSEELCFPMALASLKASLSESQHDRSARATGSVGCCPQYGSERPWSFLLAWWAVSRRACGLISMMPKSPGWIGLLIALGSPLGARFDLNWRVTERFLAFLRRRICPLLSILPIGANPRRGRSAARVAAGHHV